MTNLTTHLLGAAFAGLVLFTNAAASPMNAGGCQVNYTGAQIGEFTTLQYRRVVDAPVRSLEVTCTRRPGGKADIVVRLPLADGAGLPEPGDYAIGGSGINSASLLLMGEEMKGGSIRVHSAVSGKGVVVEYRGKNYHHWAEYRIVIGL